MDYTSIFKFHNQENVTDEFMRKIKSYIGKISSIANKHDGYVFGGIVRDLYVRNRDAKDIDIWFEDEKKIDLFIAELVTVNVKVKFYSYRSTENIYGFSNKKYTFTFEDDDYYQIVFLVDIVWNETFPCNDFHANSLILIGDEIAHLDNDRLTCESIITMINNNQMYAKPEFIQKVENITKTTD